MSAFRFLRQPARTIAPRPPANRAKVPGSGVAEGGSGGSVAGAVIGVMVQLEPFQETISLEVVELFVAMNCDPSNCSQ